MGRNADFCTMDQEHNGPARTILEFARERGVPGYTVALPCAFCFCSLTLLDKINFETKRLSLIHKNGLTFGCCKSCVPTCAFMEQNLFYCRTTSVLQACVHFQKQLPDLDIRCNCCLKPFTLNEKKDLYTSLSPVIWVRNNTGLRAKCSICRL